MSTTPTCDNCGEEVGTHPVKRGHRVYCYQACAFDAGRSADCGGRPNSVPARPVVEPIEKETTAR